MSDREAFNYSKKKYVIAIFLDINREMPDVLLSLLNHGNKYTLKMISGALHRASKNVTKLSHRFFETSSQMKMFFFDE